MSWHRQHLETTSELTDDLAKALPRWVSLIPLVGKRSFRWWQRRRAAARPENNCEIDLVSGRIDIPSRDEGSVSLRFIVTNLGKRDIEIDRLELHVLSVNSRQLQRRSDTIKMVGTVRARSVGRNHVEINLHVPDIRTLVQSVDKAQNLCCSPRANIGVYCDILCLASKGRFRKTLQAQVSEVECNIGNQAAETYRPELPP